MAQSSLEMGEAVSFAETLDAFTPSPSVALDWADIWQWASEVDVTRGG